MKIKYLISLVVLWAAFVSLPVLAQVGGEFFIYFYGHVQYVPPPPCTPDVTSSGKVNNSTSNPRINLSRIRSSDLLNPGDTMNGALVSFRANGCTGFNINHMWVYFTANDVDGEGRVIPNGSSSLRFELVDEDSGNRIRVGQGGGNSAPDVTTQGTAAPFSGAHLTSSNRGAEKIYRVRYYTPTGGAQSGIYSAPMTAHFRYY